MSNTSSCDVYACRVIFAVWSKIYGTPVLFVFRKFYVLTFQFSSASSCAVGSVLIEYMCVSTFCNHAQIELACPLDKSVGHSIRVLSLYQS